MNKRLCLSDCFIRVQKVSLSMKYVSQGDGRDLDVGNANASADAVRGKAAPRGRAPIVVGDALDPMVRERGSD